MNESFRDSRAQHTPAPTRGGTCARRFEISGHPFFLHVLFTPLSPTFKHADTAANKRGPAYYGDELISFALSSEDDGRA